MLTNKKTLLLITALILVLIVILVIQTVTEKGQVHPSPKPSQPTGIGTETEEFKKAEAEYVKSTPILQKLPANSPYFSIKYVDEQHLIVYPKIDDKNQAFQAAKEWFAKNGIDTSKITIEYRQLWAD